jgi:hypothetical protein
MRILVTGSRTWTDIQRVKWELLRVYAPGNVLVSGHCPRGADAIAEAVWTRLHRGSPPLELYPAQWETFGRSAGYRRNKVMVDTNPDLVLAFIKDKSPGATGCVNLALAKNIETRVFRA